MTSGAALAADLPVDGPQALKAALAAPEPGSVLVLAAGDYGALDLQGLQGSAAAPIIIKSADPLHPARIASLALRGVAHLHFEHLVFDYAFAPGDSGSTRPFSVTDSQDVGFAGNLFDGDLARGLSAVDDGFPTGFALSLHNCTQIAVTGNEIRGFGRGLVVEQTTDLAVQANNLHDIRIDGMDFAQVVRVTIAANHIHDFTRDLAAADHSDMIQFWTNRTTVASHDITIRDNLLNAGAGLYTQSIFMRNDQVDQKRAGPEMFYRNITISGNLILNAHLHGITVGETTGLTITNNAVLHNARANGPGGSAGLWTPQIRVAPAAQNVMIARNVTAAITGYARQSDWQVSQNLIVQDTGGKAKGLPYEQVFGLLPQADPTDPASFAPKPGGPLDGTGIGPALLHGISPVPWAATQDQNTKLPPNLSLSGQ